MAKRRVARKERLLQAGFLAQEAQVLSKVPAYVPYIKELTNQRAQTILGYRMQGLGANQIQRAIKEGYRKRNWINSIGRLNVWAMVRAFEDDYRIRQPEYRSPSAKQPKHVIENFDTKRENTIAKRKRLGYT